MMARDDDSPRTAAESSEPEETIVVDRDGDAATIVVDREDHTVVVDREDHTVVVDRGGEDGTAVVERPALRPRARGRRRGIALPPRAPANPREAIDAVGPGAVLRYSPREIRELPPLPAPLENWNTATRADAPSMPSVRRRSRRFGAVALAAFAVSCVVSVAGLIALGVAVWGG